MKHDPEYVARRETPTTTLRARDYLVMKPLIDWLHGTAPAYAKGILIDFGCGNKPYLPFFEGGVHSYVGVDLTQNSFDTVDILLERGSRLPHQDSSVDTVLSTQVLEHVPDPEQYLMEIQRVLKPGGHLILTCPGAYMLHEEPHDYYRYTIYGLKHLLTKHQMEPLRVDPAGGAWRLIGQTILNHNTFGSKFSIPLLSKIIHAVTVVGVNILFSVLDSLNTNTKDTVNYMLVARKMTS